MRVDQVPKHVIDKSKEGVLMPMGKTFDFASTTLVVDVAVCGSSQTQQKGMIDGHPTTVVAEIAYILVSPTKAIDEMVHVSFVHYDVSDSGDEARAYFGRFFNGIGLEEKHDGADLGSELAAMLKIAKNEKAQIVCSHMSLYWKLIGNALENTGIYPHVISSRPFLEPCWFYEKLGKLPASETVVTRKDELDLEAKFVDHLREHRDRDSHCCLWPVFRAAMVLKDLMTKNGGAKTD
jgi:hypothetical protein